MLAKVPKGNTEMVAAAIRAVFAQPTGPLVRAQVEIVAAMLAPKLPVVADMQREAREEITAFADFPEAHWRKVWSTNPLERLNREVKRRTDGLTHKFGIVTWLTHKLRSESRKCAQRGFEVTSMPTSSSPH